MVGSAGDVVVLEDMEDMEDMEGIVLLPNILIASPKHAAA